MWIISSHYVSESGLSWDAMFKMTKIELELIPDPDMYIFFEKGTTVQNLMTHNKNQNIFT